MLKKNLIYLSIIVFIILLIPLIAMQFSNEVNWDITDFLVAGILLFGIGLSIDFVLRKVGNVKYRIIICLLLLLVFILIWAELSVGILEHLN